MKKYALAGGLFIIVAGAAKAQDLLEPLVIKGTVTPTDQAVLGAEETSFYDLDNTGDLTGIVPGFTLLNSDSAGFGDVMSIRGTGNTLFFGQAGVAYYVDGVPSGDVYTYPTEFVEVEQVQIWRGPQGTRFGRNGAGGLIEVDTFQPTAEKILAAGFEYGSYDSYGLRVRSGGAISDTLNHSIQAYYHQRDGYLSNSTIPGNIDDRERYGILGMLAWNPAADLEIKFRAAYDAARDGAQRLTSLDSPDPFLFGSDFIGRSDLDRLQLSLHAKSTLNNGLLFSSVSSFQTWDLDPTTVDLDFSGFPGATSTVSQDQRLWTQEFRLSQTEGALRWNTGLFFMRKETGGDAGRTFLVPTEDPTVFNSVAENTLFDIDETSLALFGNLTYDFAPSWSAEVGARLEYVESEIDRAKDISVDGFPVGRPAANLEADGVYFSPSLAVSRELSDRSRLFARTSLGIKPHGFTAFSDNPARAEFDEETNWSTEIGFQTASANDCWSLEILAFWNQIDDYQINRSVPNGTDFIVANAQEVRSRGVEATGIWRPRTNLTLRGAAGFTDISFREFNDPDFGDLSGNEVPFVPEFTASLGARYDFGNGFFAQSVARFNGETYYNDVDQNPAFQDGSYVIVDAQIGYEAENWRAVVFGRNLFDENYYNFIYSQVNAGSPGAPQVFGVKVDFEF